MAHPKYIWYGSYEDVVPTKTFKGTSTCTIIVVVGIIKLFIANTY